MKPLRVRRHVGFLFIVSLLSTMLFVRPAGGGEELGGTRTGTYYMTSNWYTVNNLWAQQLGATQSNLEYNVRSSVPPYWGIRIWVRHADGGETEIQPGWYKAVVYGGRSTGLRSSSWICPETSLVCTDAIVVRVYSMTSGYWNSWAEAVFITEQLGATKLLSTVWTVYYFTWVYGEGVTCGTRYWYFFCWGTPTCNSRIENLAYVSNVYAYSSDYEFRVPDDGDIQVTYHHTVEMFIPSEWNNHNFRFEAVQVDDWVLNVKIDGTLKYSGSTGNPPCQLVYVDLGPLSSGFHTLEFDFVEQWLSGLVEFYVSLDGDPNLGKAPLTHFNVYVPGYSDNDYRYTVITTTYFMGDNYFLGGYADDYIDDVWLDAGLIWQDWMWDGGPFGAIYSWGDGFMYPLGWRGPSWHTITFTYGEIWGAGKLDFEFISGSNQQNKIGQPKFYTLANAAPKTTYEDSSTIVGSIESATLYGGSKWGGTAGISDRFFENRLGIRSGFNYIHYGFPDRWGEGEYQIGLGVGWAKPDMPLALNDIGITLNLTSISFTTDIGGYDWWGASLENINIDIYSFPKLDLMGTEFTGPDSRSIVNSDWTVALDYTGTVIMFVSTMLEQPEGALVGLAMKGIAAYVKFSQGQSVPSYTEQISEYHHRQIKANIDLFTGIPGSKSSAVFIKLSPNEHSSCGLTKIVLRGTLTAMGCTQPWPLPLLIKTPHPMADIEITIYIPWFIW